MSAVECLLDGAFEGGRAAEPLNREVVGTVSD
jgi:hypothetical protein